MKKRVFINKLSEAERDYRRFETTWYSPTVDSDSEYNLGAPVRQQLVAELMKREPEFKVEFTAESELVTAGRVLGNKVSPYQLNSTPASVYEVFGVIRGDGGFQVQDEAPHSYGIQIWCEHPEVALAGKDPLLAQLAKSVIDQKAEGSLGLALVHEEIHSRTGVYRQSENSMPFQTPDLAAEIPTVLYEVLMITDSYHQWKARGDPNYDFDFLSYRN